jgi:hypothetical protein
LKIGIHSGRINDQEFLMKQKLAWIIVAIWTIAVIGCGDEVKIVSVEPATINFNAKTNSTKLRAQGLTLRGDPIPGIKFNMLCDNTSVAEVDADGMVKPVGNGTATIIVTTPEGKKGEAFVKVCLPTEIKCTPESVLNLRVGTAAPIKCHVEDCNGETLPNKLDYVEADKDALFKDPTMEGTFVGKVTGKTQVTVKGSGLEKVITVEVAEQIFSPGGKPGTGGSGGGGGKRNDRNKDPYNEKSGGQFNHILSNMKFN